MASCLNLNETKAYLIAWREYYDKDALALLVTCNNGLVRFFAKKYLNKGLSYDELVSAGNEGLVNAINKFDYVGRDIQAFSSYISIAIENTIRRDLKKYNKHKHVLSFNQPIGQNKHGDEFTIEEIIGSDSEELVENIISEMKNDVVRDALKGLTSRERQIILLRYGLDEANRKTLEEIAEIFGCSRTTISNQEQKALIKMRHPRNTKKLKDFLDD